MACPFPHNTNTVVSSSEFIHHKHGCDGNAHIPDKSSNVVAELIVFDTVCPIMCFVCVVLMMQKGIVVFATIKVVSELV